MSLRNPISPSSIVVVGVLAAATVGVVLALVGSLVWAFGVGLVLLAAALHAAWLTSTRPVDPGRRRFLAAAGAAGIGIVAGGTGIARVIERLVRSSDRAALEGMQRAVGAQGIRSLLRGFHPDRSGELQLVLAPFNTTNYPHESRSLRPRDPRSSHALLWGYTDRVPIVVYAPGLVQPGEQAEEATLADLAPSTAHLMGFEFGAPDGRVLPGLPAPTTPPKVIVTFVIDGGGWNVLEQWPEAWPELKRLIRGGVVYTNGFMGSFPNVTASAHATIGTGAFPATHGISGHHVRFRGGITPAWGGVGQADPSYLLVPTLADAWSEETGERAWIGNLGYQVWHIGMTGEGGRPLGRTPVSVYWDESADDWAPQHPDRYRLPGDVPQPAALARRLRSYFGEAAGAEIMAEGGRALCCDPPIVHHQGELIERTLDAEQVGRHDATDLLYINYKAPDYAGHTFNMLDPRERIALEAVDEELGRLARSLERRFAPGEFVLIVTADHGQVPLVEEAGGVRLDTVQLTEDVERRFGSSIWRFVENVRPSEIFVDGRALWDGGVSLEEVAAALAGYRYGENIGPYVEDAVVDASRMAREEFAAVFPATFLQELRLADADAAGPGSFPGSDPGPPHRLW